MTRWFTSDLHFGHARINELAGRPIASVEKVDAAIVANWNDRVGADDEVWILGDVCMIRLGPEGNPRSALVDVSHFPYADHSHDERDFSEYRPVDAGRWLLHGHVHEAWRVNGRQINVGVGVWNIAPVAEATLLDIVAGEGSAP